MASLAALAVPALLSDRRARKEGKKNRAAAAPKGFTSPGLDVSIVDGRPVATRGAGVSNRLTQQEGLLGAQASRLGLLRGQVQPGLSRLTTEGVAALDKGRSALGARRQSILDRLSNRRRSSIGNLRQNLARRGVAGSSFASDAAARTEAEFLQQEQDIESQFGEQEAQFAQREADLKQRSFLAELDIQTNLINQESSARLQASQQFIDQANFETGIAATISSGVSAVNSANANAQSQLAAQRARTLGAGLGSLASFALSPNQQTQQILAPSQPNQA